jgi:hypothetical protein
MVCAGGMSSLDDGVGMSSLDDAGGMSSLDDGVRSWYMEIRVESIWEEYLGGVFGRSI